MAMGGFMIMGKDIGDFEIKGKVGDFRIKGKDIGDFMIMGKVEATPRSRARPAISR